jgi:hypothetical protein
MMTLETHPETDTIADVKTVFTSTLAALVLSLALGVI